MIRPLCRVCLSEEATGNGAPVGPACREKAGEERMKRLDAAEWAKKGVGYDGLKAWEKEYGEAWAAVRNAVEGEAS